jgi:hypothetical protein
LRSLSSIPGIEAALIQVDGATTSLLLASIYVDPEPPRTVSQEDRRFLHCSTSTTPLFSVKPTFIRITTINEIHASILDGVFSPVENYCIELEDPLFELNGDHLPV